MLAKTVFAFAALSAAPIFAQTADLFGRVSDPSGLPVPNARISLRSETTGVNRSVMSNRQGLYSVAAIPSGSWDIVVEAAGFKSLRQRRVALEVDQRATMDFSLSIGDISEVVTVEGSAPLINST